MYLCPGRGDFQCISVLAEEIFSVSLSWQRRFSVNLCPGGGGFPYISVLAEEVFSISLSWQERFSVHVCPDRKEGNSMKRFLFPFSLIQLSKFEKKQKCSVG